MQLDVSAVGSLDVSNSLADGRNLVRREEEHLPWNKGGFQAAAPSPTPPPAAPPLAPAPQAAPPAPGQPGISEVRSAPAHTLSGPVIGIIGLLVAVSCIAAIIPYVINRRSVIDKVGSDEQGAVTSGDRGASSRKEGVAKSSYQQHRKSRKEKDTADAPLLAAEQRPEAGASTSSGSYRSQRKSRTPVATIGEMEEETEERLEVATPEETPNERQSYRTKRAARTGGKAVDEATNNAEAAPLEAPAEIQKPQSYRSQRASRKPVAGSSGAAADEQISNTEGTAEVAP